MHAVDARGPYQNEVIDSYHDKVTPFSLSRTRYLTSNASNRIPTGIILDSDSSLRSEDRVELLSAQTP